jgi:outer membrane protein assembly factor BamB
VICRTAALVALLGVVSACGSTPEREAGRVDGPPVRKERRKAKPSGFRAFVTVVDGDTDRRVEGARVVIGTRSDHTDAKGRAFLKVRQKRSLPVRVSKAGYGTKVVRAPFARNRRVTVRLFHPDRQWPMYGANVRRTQAHGGISLRPPFRVVWSRGLGSLVEFPAVVEDGVAFVGNFRGTITALAMRDGARVWRYDPPGGKMASSPAVAGDSVVVHGMDGVVRVLDRRNGRLRWQLAIGSPIESSPVVRNGIDYFGAWNGRVYALDLAKRRLRWSRATGAKITSSAALAGRTLFIGTYGAQLLALDTRTGALRWSRGVNGRVYGTPAVARGRVFVPSSTGGTLTAFSTGGRYLWRVGTGAYVYSSPAVWGGRVFFGSYDGRLYAVGARDGRRLWSVDAGGPVSGAAVVVSGVAYAGSTWGRITGVDVRTGRVLLRFPHGEYVPVSGNGKRLLLHGYSRIWAVEPR